MLGRVRLNGPVRTRPVAGQAGGALVRIHQHFLDGNLDCLVRKQRHQVGEHCPGFHAGLCEIAFVMATTHEVHASARRSHRPVPHVARLQVSLEVKRLAQKDLRGELTRSPSE